MGPSAVVRPMPKPAASLVLLFALTSAAEAQTPAPLTAGELNGSWNLTIRANPPEAKGPKITFGEGATSLVLRLDMETQNGRLNRCLTRKASELPKPITCRLEKGALLLDVPASARDQQGFLSLRLARTSSGAIAGPATARPRRLPMRIKVGTAALSRVV